VTTSCLAWGVLRVSGSSAWGGAFQPDGEYHQILPHLFLRALTVGDRLSLRGTMADVAPESGSRGSTAAWAGVLGEGCRPRPCHVGRGGADQRALAPARLSPSLIGSKDAVTAQRRDRPCMRPPLRRRPSLGKRSNGLAPQDAARAVQGERRTARSPSSDRLGSTRRKATTFAPPSPPTLHLARTACPAHHQDLQKTSRAGGEGGSKDDPAARATCSTVESRRLFGTLGQGPTMPFPAVARKGFSSLTGRSKGPNEVQDC